MISKELPLPNTHFYSLVSGFESVRQLFRTRSLWSLLKDEVFRLIGTRVSIPTQHVHRLVDLAE